MRIADQADDHSALVSALNNLGNIYGDLDRDQDAVAALARAIQVSDDHDLPELACMALGNLDSHYRLRGAFERAEAAYRDVLKRFEVLDNDQGRVSALGFLGMLEETRNDLPKARDYWTRGLELGRAIGVADRRYFETALKRTEGD